MSVPTGVLGVECGAGRAPPSTPWAPGLWPPPHGPMPLAAVFIPSSGPLGLPGSSAGKEFTCSAGDLGLIPGLGRSPGEKGMATHFSILGWRIPWTEEPGPLELQRVRNN